MIRIDKPNQPIFEVQRFLYELGLYYEWLPAVFPDGIYGENTEEAIKQFQKHFELPITGVVDINTWQLLYAQFNEAKNSRTSLPSPSLSPNTLPFAIGDRGYGPSLLHQALIELGRFYPSLPLLLPTSIYQASTVAAIKALQRVYRKEETGMVDIALWNALFEDLHSKQRAESILLKRKTPSAFLALAK